MWTTGEDSGPPGAVRQLRDDGRYEQAEQAARETLSRAIEDKGAESLEAAEAREELVRALILAKKTGDPRARQLAEEALRIRERLLGPDDPAVAGSLNILGEVLFFGADYPGALAALERARAIEDRTMGAEDPRRAATLALQGVVHGSLGAYAEAQPLLERALAIREAALGVDHLDVAESLSDLGWLRQTTGDPGGARSAFTRALAIRERLLRPDHPAIARNLAQLGWVCHASGDYAEAMRYYERARAIRERTLPPGSVDIGRSLDSIGAMKVILGDYAEAIPLFERALEIFEKALGDHPERAATLMKLGRLRQSMGDVDEAKRLYRQAVSIWERSGHARLAEGLNDLGYLLYVMGDLRGARAQLGRALALHRKQHGPESAPVASTLERLAGVVSSEGNLAEARRLYEQALAIEQRQTSPEEVRIAEVLHRLAKLHHRAGRRARATELSARALSMREELLGPEHPILAESLALSGRLLAEAGEDRRALDASLRAEQLARRQLAHTLTGLVEREALRLAAVRESGLDIALSLVDRVPESSRRVWDALVRSRALILDEGVARQRAAVGTEDPEVLRLRSEHESARARLANLLVRSLNGEAPERDRKLVEEARLAAEHAEKALAARSREFRMARQRERAGFEEVAAALPPGTALVAYARHFQLARGPEGATGTGRLVAAYVAFILSPGAEQPAVIHLGDAERIDALVRRWRDEITSGRGEGDANRHGEMLRERIWDPFAGRLAGAKRVFVVPDMAQHLVSLAALPSDGSRYLVETGPVIHYLSAERDVLDSGGTRGEGLLAVGAPAYDERSRSVERQDGARVSRSEGTAATRPHDEAGSGAGPQGRRSACGDLAKVRFESLPGSLAEVEAIASMWKAAGHSPAEGRAYRSFISLTGPEATEAAIKKSASGQRILHLATHGFFLGGEGCPSTLVSLRGISRVSFESEKPVRVVGEPPLLLSGLALAGANLRERANAGEEDGILTAEEIAALDLSGVDWAVLSACDTGLGRLQAGEGVFGLRRAFLVAGARTVIMSLWGVEDEATRQWMAALYRARLIEGLDTADAVQRASLDVLEERRAAGKSTHPFLWGGFVATGDWR